MPISIGHGRVILTGNSILNETLTGYASSEYAASLAEFGEPRSLPFCGGNLLLRAIPGSRYLDAMGPYPLFSCLDWSRLPEDLDALSSELVSTFLVLDPFGAYDHRKYGDYFDLFRPFKTHYVLELREDWEEGIKSRHKKNARHGFRISTVVQVDRPVDYADIWTDLYGNLIRRHHLKGIHAFSLTSFKKQLSIPGCRLYLVYQDENVIGGNIFYIQNDVAYGHLSAFTDAGYAIDASYSVLWYAFKCLEKEVRYVNLGGCPGQANGESGGLCYFKEGWSNGSRKVYLAGKVHQPDLYKKLTIQAGIDDNGYFPAYRQGEF